MTNFKLISHDELQCNPLHLIGKEWMLITAENGEKINTMTASWGGLGVMWGKDVAYIVIRPQRYTKEFIDNSETFSLTFFDEEYRSILNYLGTTSGRDENKVEKANLTVAYADDTPYLEEANLVLVCKKLYHQEFKPECFIDSELVEKWYPKHDFHTLYIAEISKILVKD